jgi:hypothetical protein
LWKIVIQNRALSKFHITPIFFCKTKPKTMGVVRHDLCRRPWQSFARSSAMPLLATLWVTPGALGLVKFELGGGLCIYFHLGKYPLIFATMVALSATASATGFLPPLWQR